MGNHQILRLIAPDSCRLLFLLESSMCVVINQFLFPSNLCDMPRFHCATCSGLPVRLAPFLLCDLLRIMHSLQFGLSSYQG